jgi:hypothetical protein
MGVRSTDNILLLVVHTVTTGLYRVIYVEMRKTYEQGILNIKYKFHFFLQCLFNKIILSIKYLARYMRRNIFTYDLL